MAITLPQELLAHVFSFCDGSEIRALRQSSRVYRSIVGELRGYKWIRLVNHWDQKLKELTHSEGFLISNDRPAYPDIKKFTTVDLGNYFRRIFTCRGVEVARNIDQFAEDIIDALCDLAPRELNLLESPKSDDVPSVKAMALVLAKAKNREKGDVFIIPNPAYVCGERLRYHGNYGTEGGPLVSVETWVMSHRCGNWSRHAKNIDDALPAQLFLGKKEGDSVIFDLKGREIKLVCRQLSYKFNQLGPFENALEKMTRNPTHLMDVTYADNLPIEEQHRRIRAFHAECLKYVTAQQAAAPLVPTPSRVYHFVRNYNTALGILMVLVAACALTIYEKYRY